MWYNKPPFPLRLSPDQSEGITLGDCINHHTDNSGMCIKSNHACQCPPFSKNLSYDGEDYCLRTELSCGQPMTSQSCRWYIRSCHFIHLELSSPYGESTIRRMDILLTSLSQCPVPRIYACLLVFAHHQTDVLIRWVIRSCDNLLSLKLLQVQETKKCNGYECSKFASLC